MSGTRLVPRENQQMHQNQGGDNQQIHQNQSNNSQRFQSGINESSAYKSEEHRQTYQHTSQSFNEQREQYAEKAFNDDYQKPVPEPDVGEDTGYQRYVERNSIFSASDREIADATESYLDKDSTRFAQKNEKLEGKIGKTEEKIKKLETDNLQYRNSYKPWKHRLVLDDVDKESKRPRSLRSWHAKGLIHKDVIHKENETWIYGRLKFRSEKIALTERKHKEKVRKSEGESTRHSYYRRQLLSSMRDAMKGSGFAEDELASEMRSTRKRWMAAGRMAARRNYRKVSHTLDGYERLKFQKTRLEALNARRKLLDYRSGIDLQKRKAAEAARQGLLREEKRRKVQKELTRNYKRQQGNFFNRVQNQHKMKKTVKKEKRMARKRTKTLISASLFFLLLTFFIIIIFFIFVTAFTNIGGDSISQSTSQNDYGDMTDVTEYFRGKEAELEERIKPENLQEVILADEPDIYEFIYDMADIGFDANTLVAYLSAKYNEFNLELVKEDLDAIFEIYYTLNWEIKEEYRMLPDTTQQPDPVTGDYPLVNTLVKICYVTLEKADFYELLQGRIDDEAKQNQMDAYYLSGNGQQVYGPVMNVDWRNKISSNFGERVHPITGAITFHDGVDIAVPTGTALYSAVKGTVIQSRYSDSAGNMITVKTDSGWEITFMHMDSRAVSAGEKIDQGQYVGTSGNTGNSTGPHLHIQVHDAEGNKINPVFIIPYSTLEASETFNTGGSS